MDEGPSPRPGRPHLATVMYKSGRCEPSSGKSIANTASKIIVNSTRLLDMNLIGISSTFDHKLREKLAHQAYGQFG